MSIDYTITTNRHYTIMRELVKIAGIPLLGGKLK
jgi:hypothetical protein